MTKSTARNSGKASDSIQERLTNYARGLRYEDLSHDAVHAAKVRIIDTLGALIGGFFGEPCRIARALAAGVPVDSGSTVIGTRMKTTPDLAAFANGTTARYMEMNDGYHRPGVMAGHPSDCIAPLLSVAELAQANGREFITAVILAYEVHLRNADNVKILTGFDYTNYVCMAVATAAGRLLGLDRDRLAHGISMAVVPNNTLFQVRTGHLTMYKAMASGQAGRAGVFAAMLAHAGMEGPHLPFEGKAGWCDHIALKRYALETMGGGATPFRINDTLIKTRPSGGTTIPCILAAENAKFRGHVRDVKQVIVETYKRAKDQLGTDKEHWNPESRESADHSIAYVVAAAVMDGTVTPRSFDDAHLWNPDLRALLQRVEVVENSEFTAAYERTPVQHRTRVTVVTSDGQKLVGESGGAHGDLSDTCSDAAIEEKFRRLTEDRLGSKRASVLLDRLWHVENENNVAVIPPALVLG